MKLSIHVRAQLQPYLLLAIAYSPIQEQQSMNTFIIMWLVLLCVVLLEI